MYKLNSHIKVGNISFDFVCDVETKESLNTLTDTCTIKLPKKLSWQDNNIFFGQNALIKHKDIVIVKLGYDDKLTTVFKGYVREIKRKVPVELHCEDEMFQLKQRQYEVQKKQWDNVNLSDLLTYILPSGQSFKCPIMQLGKFTIDNNVPPIKVLEHLTKKDGYGLQIYFHLDNEVPVLYAGMPRSLSSTLQKSHKFRFSYNIISDNIEFHSEDNVKVQVKCTSIMNDNTRHEITLGDTDGNMHTFNEQNISKDALKQYAEQKLNSLKKEGYTGTITVFGEPYVRKGDYVSITGDNYVNDVFSYGVSDVVRKYGASGYRQQITLDSKK